MIVLLMSLLAVAAPDLAVDTVYECTDAGTHEAWVEVRNDGTSSAPGTYVDVFVGWAVDELDPSPPMGTWGDFYAYIPGLAAGERRWEIVPLGSSSPAWIDVIVDTDGFIAESDESNNTTRGWSDFSTCALADLDVLDLVTPITACAGDDIGPLTSLTLHNPGAQTASGLAHIGWYLSDDAVFDWGDDLLGGGRDQVSDLPATTSEVVGIGTNVIPSSATPGAYYLIVRIDEFDGVAEDDETDNVVVQPITIEDCPSQVVQMAPGTWHTCALLDTGAVRCWGLGLSGYTGLMTPDIIGDDELPSSVPDVDVGGDVIQIDSGRYTCVVLDTGGVRCWGEGSSGQLGYGDTDDIGDDEPPSAAGDIDLGGPAEQVSVGSWHACALMSGGDVRCWGNNERGQLGYVHTDWIGDDETPANEGPVQLGGPAVQIASGSNHNCALMATGAVRCWGDGENGQLGYASTDRIGDDETPASAGDVDLGGIAVAIDADGSRSCALMDTGAVRCWGFNFYGLLGYGHTDDIGDDEPPAAAGDLDLGGAAVEVTMGGTHTCALLDTGDVRCWGAGIGMGLALGPGVRVGDDETPAEAPFVDVGAPVIGLDASADITCALLDDGSMKCWGSNHFGELGIGGFEHIGDDELPSVLGPIEVW